MVSMFEPGLFKVQLSLIVAFTVSIGGSPTVGQTGRVPSDALIKLERTRCFGQCPAYWVTIEADGRVIYEGRDFVRVKGRQTARISPGAVAALLETAERIGFFNLNDAYRARVTDNPTTFVTITRAGRTKTIEDYVSAPAAVKDLESKIDEAAGTRRWVRIDSDTLGQMLQDGWVPSVDERNELFRNALAGDDVDVINELLQIGADPNSFGARGGPPLAAVRSAAAAQVLIDAGAHPSPVFGGRSPLLSAVWFAPALTEVLLEAGAKVDHTSESQPGRTPLYEAACIGNAGVVRLLLEAGANPEVRVNGMSILDCVRRDRAMRAEVSRIHPPLFEEDFEAVIDLIERAIEQRRQ
jgi:hypothetical protein